MAPNITTVEALIQETFLRILDILAQLGIYRKSPKFFIIYAHDNEKLSGYKAHSELVKTFIEWFKKLQFDVDSDRSPHGRVPGRGLEIEGASVDIIKNQLCLLPQQLGERNVSYVLIFGSKLLEKYMEDEAALKPIGGKSYITALVDACQACTESQPKELSESVCKDITDHIEKEVMRIQSEYSTKMGDVFHHVLTEMALVDFREGYGSSSYTLPIHLGELCKQETCFPKSISANRTRLRVFVDPENAYESLFKLLLKFESLQDDQSLIEALRDAFDECVMLLKDEKTRGSDQSRNECEAILLSALRKLTNSERYRERKRQITTPSIRQILNMQALLGLSSIRRISGEKLPAGLNDIELAVIPPGATKSDNQSSVQNDRKQQLVPLDKLFEMRKLTDTREESPKRIHIQGSPGIGKSTLSRRIMYEYSWNQRLRSMFDLVILLPLRRLEHSSNLEQILFEGYFRLEPRGHKFAAALCDLVLKLGNEEARPGKPPKSKTLPNDDAKVTMAHGQKILFILDGLDETRGWPKKNQEVLVALANKPNVVITSRLNASGLGDAIKPIDLEIEATGLSLESIRDYLGNKDLVSPKNAEEIRTFIESNIIVQEMIRVPIHLDILSYGWNELPRGKSHAAVAGEESENSEESEDDKEFEEEETMKSPTITELYKAITQKLFRNDILRLKKYDNGEILTEDIVDAVRDEQRLLRVVQQEIDLLGELAFTLMNKSHIVFTDKSVENATRKLEKRLGPLPLRLERDLPMLSCIVLDSGQEGLHGYRFAHLTLQEFFAAQYLARNSDELQHSFRRFKYNRRWEVVWRFVAGLVSSNREQLGKLFSMLEEEPRDLAGFRHARLTMNCLAECASNLSETHRQSLHGTLAAWLTLELRIRNYKGRIISSEPGFPERIIVQILDEIDPKSALFIRTMLSGRLAMSEKLWNSLIDLVQPYFEDPSSDLGQQMYPGCDITPLLMEHSLLPGPIIQRLLHYLQENHFQRPAWLFAASILQCRQLPEWALLELTEILESTNGPKSDFVRGIFLRQRELTSAVCKCLVRISSQQRRLSTQMMVHILREQSRLPHDVVRELSDQLHCSHPDSWLVGCSNVDIGHILASQAELEPEVIEKLRYQLQTTNPRQGISLAIELVRHPALYDDVFRSLLAAIEAKLETTPSEINGVGRIWRALLSIPTDLSRQLQPQVFTKLLLHKNQIARDLALSTLREHAHFDGVGRKLLHKAIKEEPFKLIDFLGRRVELVIENPIPWAISLLKSEICKLQDPDNPHSTIINCRLLMSLLGRLPLGESDKHSQVYEQTILDAMESSEGERWWLTSLLREIPRLKQKTVERLFALLERCREDAAEVLSDREEASSQALDLLKRTDDEEVARLATKVLMFVPSYLPDQLIEQIGSIFQARVCSGARLEKVANLLANQKKLPLNIIRALDDAYRVGRIKLGHLSIENFWYLLSKAEFCRNANSFEEANLKDMLKPVFLGDHPLYRAPTDDDAVWIHGDHLYHDSVDGITKYKLDDEKKFRSSFRKAQSHWNVPEWMWIGTGSVRKRSAAPSETPKKRLRILSFHDKTWTS